MSGMKIHSLVQGTPEWHAHREAFFNASDAPAMLDCSPHKSRTQLLNEVVSGIKSEINLFTQKIFDDARHIGHVRRDGSAHDASLWCHRPRQSGCMSCLQHCCCRKVTRGVSW